MKPGEISLVIFIGAMLMAAGFLIGRQTVFNDIDITSNQDSLECTNDLVAHTTMLTNIIAQQLEFEKGVTNESNRQTRNRQNKISPSQH